LTEPIDLPKGQVKHILSADIEPVLTVTPGARVRIETELNIGDWLHSVDERFEPHMLNLPYANGATGPIRIDGAAAGRDMVVCDIERIELHPPGFTALVPGVGAFPDWIRGREFGVHSRVVDVRDGEVIWSDRVRIPIRPMVGVIGTAPLVGGLSTLDNGPNGGNLDVPDLGEGCRVYLPVSVDGALFSLGDCHAVQGDGELCGVGAIEIRTHTTVRLDVTTRPARMTWPRFETDTHIGTIACAKPLEDAFRLAVQELVHWMADEHGFDEPGALLLLGQVAEARCAQVVNPKYTYTCAIAKRYLGA
jgi:amidase